MQRRVRVVTEAIMVVDLVESTVTTDRFGWYAVGQRMANILRERIQQIGPQYGLSCLKSTGDGALLAFTNKQSAESAAIHAVEAAFAILDNLQRYNQHYRVPIERRINLRFAIHFGQVDAVEFVGLAGITEADRLLLNDREGPHVTYTFRLEAIDALSLGAAHNPIPPQNFPQCNYIIASEQVMTILDHDPRWSCLPCGIFRLKGFTGWHEAFLISRV